MKDGKQEDWKKRCVHYLPNFQSSNSSVDQKHKFNIETCLAVKYENR